MSGILVRAAVMAAAVAAVAGGWVGLAGAQARPVGCLGGELEPAPVPLAPEGPVARDLVVKEDCRVRAGTYYFQRVNIIAGGTLRFDDAAIDFWAWSIVVENGGSLVAGTPEQPIGTQGGVVTIHLYGADQGAHPYGTSPGGGGRGIRCVSDPQCGVPPDTWHSGSQHDVSLPGGVTDRFYAYHPLPYDDGDPEAFFGYKVLAVSYGGALRLFGRKGATYGEVASSNSGTSWVRLAGTANPGDTTLTLDRPVDWEVGDRIVVTTTDYLPGHSEQLTIAGIGADRQTIAIHEPLAHRHNGQRYDLSRVPARLGLSITAAETRAAVALLTRSIRIVSAGDRPGDPFPSGPGHYFGGHTIVRQGVAAFQVQGVEFYQLGQGGRLGRYPVHFHMARRTPPDTFVKDSSVHDSMTRWFVLHATHGVTLARNVGYLSIGHGYYLEDGTEIDNRLLTNIGILARAAVDNAQNPRRVPGILAARPDPARPESVPFYSDYDHPTVFWIMNGWNDFEYNMAAGAGTCGACYWLVPGANSAHSRHMHWTSYASMQQGPLTGNALERAATTPLRRFVGNSCTSAMNSFNTVGNTTPCFGVAGPEMPRLDPVENPLAPDWCAQTNPTAGPDQPRACALHPPADEYYPKVDQGGGRFATRCDGPEADCSQVPRCSAGTDQNCMITALDRYTSSFHWAETNFAAIWLRPQWYLVTDSVLTDVQNGGLTMVTGGGYTAADIIPGHWALVRKTAFVGHTQPDNPYASPGGPVNPHGLRCDGHSGNHCLAHAEGVSFPISNFGMNQRLFNIYDGPAYQDSNAYLDTTPLVVDDCHPSRSPQTCSQSQWLAGHVLGLPRDGAGAWGPPDSCYMPNAGIAWKQPNGFYYPPAFHSANLFFDNVPIRHFVIQPLFQPGTFRTSPDEARARYCTWNGTMFDNFTDIDRQTELSDDDGSLTGYAETISVNVDPFFAAPVEGIECASDGTAKTSPYDHVTSVVYHFPPGPDWSSDCGNPTCYGVPLYRQLLTASESAAPSIRMMGQDKSQRSALTVNHGVYYLDTTVGEATQRASGAGNLNVFRAGQTYQVFLVFAKPTTRQTYQLYVGPGFDLDHGVWPTRADIGGFPIDFSAPGTTAWPPGWSRAYDAATGVLTVTMDMGFPEFAADYEVAREHHCRPASFCAWHAADRKCRCALSPGQDLYESCHEKNAAGDDAICAWAVKDVDCPGGGCWGFAVKLADGFATDPPVNPRPQAACFPADEVWNVSWQPASADLAGACFQAPVDPPKFCR